MSISAFSTAPCYGDDDILPAEGTPKESQESCSGNSLVSASRSFPSFGEEECPFEVQPYIDSVKEALSKDYNDKIIIGYDMLQRLITDLTPRPDSLMTVIQHTPLYMKDLVSPLLSQSANRHKQKELLRIIDNIILVNSYSIEYAMKDLEALK